jgi:RNA polymerase sigma-70 factor (ECF subfamily)
VNPEQYATRPTIFLRLKATDAQPRELAWIEFRNRYSPMMAAFARRLGVREQDVDDIIQEVITGFYAQVPVFEYDPAKGRFRGFLKVCTYRIVRKHLDKSARRAAVEDIDLVDPPDPKLDEDWDAIWQQERLRRAIELVRDDYGPDNTTFRAFELYVMQGKEPEDAAKELDLSVASIYQAKKRITEAIKKKLERLEAEED